MNKKYIAEVNRLKKIELKKKQTIRLITKEMEVKQPYTQNDLIEIIKDVTKTNSDNDIKFYFRKCIKIFMENKAKSYNNSNNITNIKGAH